MLARLSLIGSLLLAAPALADPAADERAIVARLEAWAAAFNRRDAAGVCDLFAPDLVSTVPGARDGSRAAVCARLAAVLAKPQVRMTYTPDIHEVIVAGDLAVVRLSWTLTTEADGARDVSVEAGLDVFGRQADGRWSIRRFIAFPIEGSDQPAK